jgi:hypothetical protein
MIHPAIVHRAWVAQCWMSGTRVQLTPAQVEARQLTCLWCGRVVGVRPGKKGHATVPRHKRSET